MRANRVRSALLILCALAGLSACADARFAGSGSGLLDVEDSPACAASCKLNVAAGQPQADGAALEQAGQIVVQRLADLGYANARARVIDDRDLELSIPLPGECRMPERELLLSVISPGALVEFHFVESREFVGCGGSAELLEKHGGVVPEGYTLFWQEQECCEEYRTCYLLRNEPEFTSRDFKNVEAAVDQYGFPAISFELEPEAAERFAELTGNNPGKQLAILINGEVLSAPIIQDRIEAKGIINGKFNEEDIRRLVALLRSRILPLQLELGECRLSE